MQDRLLIDRRLRIKNPFAAIGDFLISNKISEIRKSDPVMSSIRMRARRQLTLPSEVVAAAGLQIDDDLDVSYVNGIIQLTPAKSRRGGAGMSRFLGAAGASYGADTEAMNEYLRQQRESW